MSAPSLLSDHVYDWSERSIKQDIVGIAQAPTELAARAAATGCDLARLADRALQALRQARLQVRRWPWPWRPQMDYVPQEDIAATRTLVANFHQVRAALEEVCLINRELLRRREAL